MRSCCLLPIAFALSGCVASPAEPGPAAPAVRVLQVTLPVSDVEHAARFYARLLGRPGERVGPGRHDFPCGEAVLACLDPRSAGQGRDARPLVEPVWLEVDDIEAAFARARGAGCASLDRELARLTTGRRLFRLEDPFGNPLCVVEGAQPR